MGSFFDALSGLVGAWPAASARARARRRHVVGLPPLLSPRLHAALSAAAVTLAICFAIVAVLFGALVFRMLSDDLLAFFGMMLFPVAGAGVLAAMQCVWVAVRFARNGPR